jgi:hypothetical protein
VDYLSALAWALFAAAIFNFTAWRRYRAALDCRVCDDVGSKGKEKKST